MLLITTPLCKFDISLFGQNIYSSFIFLCFFIFLSSICSSKIFVLFVTFREGDKIEKSLFCHLRITFLNQIVASSILLKFKILFVVAY